MASTPGYTRTLPSSLTSTRRSESRWPAAGTWRRRPRPPLLRLPSPRPSRPRRARTMAGGVIKGDGYAVAGLDDLGEGYGFRKVRKGLGVNAFGANAIVIPPSYETGKHLHEEQEELYFVHSGQVEFEFGDGSTHALEAGSFAWVDAPTVRKVRNLSDSED